jgi:membrane protein
MQDDRHTGGRAAQLASGSTRSRASPSTRSHPAPMAQFRMITRAEDRQPTHWKFPRAAGKTLFRAWKNIGKDRVIVVAAGVTFYSVLALFPAIAALVAVYGFFADPTTRRNGAWGSH